MSKLQDALISSSDVYAGGSGMVPMPEFDPADEFIPDANDSGLIDNEDLPPLDQPQEVDPEPAPTPEADDQPAADPEQTVPDQSPAPTSESVPDADPEPQADPDQSDEPRVRNKQDFLHRLNAKNKKIAERDARIAELEAQVSGNPRPSAAPAAAPAPVSPQAAIPDLQERRQRILDLTIDGNTAEAARLQAELDNEIFAAAITAATAQVVQTVKATQENETLEMALADIATTYPELDETGDAYDTKTARMINAVMAEYLEDDYSRPEALRVATDEVMRLRYPHYFQEPATNPPAKIPVSAAAPAPAAKPAVKAAVAKAAAAAVAQPGLPTGGANPRTVATAPVDVFNMSDEEFSKLTPEALKQLRGDYL